MKPEPPLENPAERELFETIKSTYSFALEPEQKAMVKELRSHLRTISLAERTALIDAVESAIGRDVEGEEFEV